MKHKVCLNRHDALIYLRKHNLKDYYIIEKPNGAPSTASVFSFRPAEVHFRELYFVAVSILAQSKVHMYHLYYDILNPAFNGRVKLRYLDTGTLCTFTIREDLYAYHA